MDQRIGYPHRGISPSYNRRLKLRGKVRGIEDLNDRITDTTIEDFKMD
jgi:hypothetical protein